MKKLIAIVLALVLLVAFAAPVMATDVDTEVTVASGTGSAPIVKCKWEAEPNSPTESGDVGHAIPGTQILPPLVQDATKAIRYYAVVTDEEEMGNLYEVFAIVYHPSGSPAPYNATDVTWGQYFKYKIVFTKLGHAAAQKTLVNNAYNAGLITFNTDYTIDEITNAAGTGELDKTTADLWMGEEVIDYEQPAGFYNVDVYAVDHNNNRSAPLHNQFEYVATCGIEVDFDAVSYGSVNLGVAKVIAGDLTWNTPLGANPATVRNIGNTWTHVTIMQDDMTFGKEGAGAGTTYQGASAPNSAQSNWNVYFDAKMGTSGTKVYYDPFVTVTLANWLALSTQDELDFSICVKNGWGLHTGTMTLGCTIEPFGPLG